MRFNCPKPETFGEWKTRIGQWRPVFAFLPHRCNDGTCRWLEYIEKRTEIKVWTYDIDKVNFYRAIK